MSRSETEMRDVDDSAKQRNRDEAKQVRMRVIDLYSSHQACFKMDWGIDMEKDPEYIKRINESPSAQTGPIIKNYASPRRDDSFKNDRDPGQYTIQMILGKKWYIFLVPREGRICLMGCEKIELGNIIICYSSRTYKCYALFSSYIEFNEYQKGFEESERSFFEVVIEQSQKPHFDIDISPEDSTLEMALRAGQSLTNFLDVLGEKVKDEVIEGIISYMQYLGFEIDLSRDILLYSSHGEKKRSYHIVMPRYCHSTNKEAEKFYQNVVSKVSPSHLDYVDASVYKSKQQFRIVGSRKLDSNRPKIFLKRWFYNNSEIEYVYREEVISPEHQKLSELYDSLLSLCSSCILLPNVLPKETPKAYVPHNEDVTDEDVEKALALLEQGCFTIIKIDGNRIDLKRHFGTMCPTCNRIHDNENPFLIIFKGRVFWHCRRSPGRTQIGSITPSQYNGFAFPPVRALEKIESNEDEEDYEDEEEDVIKQDLSNVPLYEPMIESPFVMKDGEMVLRKKLESMEMREKLRNISSFNLKEGRAENRIDNIVDNSYMNNLLLSRMGLL